MADVDSLSLESSVPTGPITPTQAAIEDGSPESYQSAVKSSTLNMELIAQVVSSFKLNQECTDLPLVDIGSSF